MKEITKLLFATSLSACLCAEAVASDKRYQISGELGVSHLESMNDYTYNIIGKKHDNALAAGIGFSKEISPSLFLGVDYSYRRFEGSEDIKQFSGGNTYKIASSDILAKNFSLNATYYMSVLVAETNLPTPFLAIGGGKSRNIQKNKYVYKIGSDESISEQDTFSGKHNAYSYKLAFGLSYPIYDDMNFEMKYEHNGFGNIRAYKESGRITNLADFNDLSYSSSLKSDSIMGSLTYRF